MKEILYLNTELMNSLLAQLSRGLIKNFSQEQSNQETQTEGQQSTIGEKAGVSGQVRIGTGWFPGADFSLNGRINDEGTESNTESRSFLEGQKDILNKEFHDYALEILVEQLKEQELLSESDENLKEGDFLLGESTFKFYDFELIGKSVNPKSFEEIALLQIYDEEMTLKEANRIINKTKLNAQEREKKTTAQKVHDIHQEIKPIVSVMKGLDNLTSFTTDLLSDLKTIKVGDKIGLLKNEYLRESAESLSFRTDNSRKLKYLVSVIGEKKIVHDGFNIPKLSPNDVDKFPNMMLDVVLGSFNIIEKGDLLVTPIAIYYE
ncbi:DUF6414 family protein [Paraliobacillus ryukyuensis]|uniref:DUF6414 family protein n=1 Tax=Paraliobacillus ryukyuensis TaxID=200904 RepID=UPI0009A74C71|nr:hypothetical protein [Paraliobacillus ryukyuensis]